MPHSATGYEPGPTESLRLLRIDDVADLLAISRDSVYRLVRRGLLPTVRVGERIRFRVVDIEAYLQRDEGGAAP